MNGSAPSGRAREFTVGSEVARSESRTYCCTMWEEVPDDRPGSAAEEATRYFERVYLADPSRTSTNGGSGLGLSIVWSIAAAHRGTITVFPRSGEEAVFTVDRPELADQSVAVEESAVTEMVSGRWPTTLRGSPVLSAKRNRSRTKYRMTHSCA